MPEAVMPKAQTGPESACAGDRASAPRLSVVIPARGEESRIAATVSEIRLQLAAVDDLEIIVVDDGSSDATARAAEDAGADQVVVHVRNRGKGAAVRSGLKVANGRVVAFTDADLAYAPSRLLDFLEAIEGGCDVAIGSRHRSGAKGERPLTRVAGSRLVNLMARIVLKGSYGDTQCGCKAFRLDVGRYLATACTVDRFAFDIEILHLVERRKLSLQQIPLEAADSDASTVRVIGDGLRLLADILRVRLRTSRGAYPPLDPVSRGAPASPDAP